jgi:long-chain acyl-CoA synthetase
MLFDLLAERAAKHPETVAVVGERSSLTYAQLHQAAGTFAVFLRRQGIKTGEAILIGVPPSPDFFVAFYGASALGLLTLPVLPTGLISDVYRKTNPAAAIGTAKFLSEVKARCGSAVLSVPWTSNTGLEFPMQGQEDLNRSRNFRDEFVLGVSSSGTTGEPRLYLRPAELIVARAKMRAEVQRLQAGDVFLASRPFNSGSAINSHVVLSVYVGGKAVVHEKFERFKAAEAIESHRVTVLYAVPFIFELLLSLPESRVYDFSSLRLCISGSAPISKFVLQRFQERFGITIRQRYSGSHFHPAFSYNLDGPPESVGRTDGLFPIVILNDASRPVPSGDIGEIVFDINRAPPNLRKTAERNPNLKGDFLHTGDLGRTDEVGNVYVVGRKSPFIKVGGYRVEPAEVENVLRSHVQVKEALVYGIALTGGDEAVAATIVVQNEVSREELLRHCASHLDAYKCPKKIDFRDSLPRSPHGKVIRAVES